MEESGGKFFGGNGIWVELKRVIFVRREGMFNDRVKVMVFLCKGKLFRIDGV